ncbi:hypothetical protein [Kibdelosporangium phytohabitans]|uniref:hypothetical protein n=1 Tax=Kibdelosporangium phytohabitans TaxID=860235 RepID=UPI0019ED12A0|nr:hypothetical protein [Kibdelosporangium phytohabitans]MBE1468187.1 hypothetical protein [Kibdelosporangium phytohabitans]
MPSVGFPALSGIAVRSLVVAIAFLPIMIMALCAIPVWAMALWRPATHGDLALRLLRGLHTWSRDVITAVYGGHNR